jgi:very-short-patch-repair endonuclease
MRPRTSKPRIRGTSPTIQQAAFTHRQQMTAAEAHLWEALKRKQVAGLRFRSQHPIGRFILDFYCPAIKLVIEVDGEIHDAQADYDRARTSALENHGYRVIRFSNAQVLSDRPSVISAITTIANSIRSTDE